MRHHVVLAPGQQVGISEEDPALVIVVDVPDTVRLPQPLGGQEVRVLEAYTRACPCGCGAQVRALRLEGGVHVAPCMHRGFIWFRPRAGA